MFIIMLLSFIHTQALIVYLQEIKKTLETCK